jgi:ABC-type transporter lipoprotein component MlaA
VWLWHRNKESWSACYDNASLFDKKMSYASLMDTLRETSLDYYGALRSLYRQKRVPEKNLSSESEEPRPLEGS